MAKYIKSKSNYVLTSKHQNVKDGYITSRDAVTIGGLDQFAKDAKPIYKSSNFVITVNNTDGSTRDLSNGTWEANLSGDFWTMDTVVSSPKTSEDTMDINLKTNFHRLSDYAYFGSCSEMVRSSINDIISKFPGELHIPRISGDSEYEGIAVYYINPTTGESERLGDDTLFLVDNPFNIDIHTDYVNEEQIDDPLKYFANEGYKNYEVIESGIAYEISSVSSKTEDGCAVGDLAYTIKIVYNEGTVPISGYIDGQRGITYLTTDNYLGYSIRPKEEFYDKFYRSLDGFEKLLMNKYTEPKYKARFEIKQETDFGEETIWREFIFPTTYGGYNLAVGDVAYTSYVDELSKVSEYYDEFYSDNLYRSLTHEAIKNFDWTKIITLKEEEVKEAELGAEKMSKVLRVIGREFDELKSYADGIKAYNNITYSDKNNIPDYFLTDVLETEGWDVKNIYGKSMKEYSGDTSADIIDSKSIDSSERITDKYRRTFDDVVDIEVSPFSTSDGKKYRIGSAMMGDYNGYYIHLASGGPMTLSATVETPNNSVKTVLNTDKECQMQGYSAISNTYQKSILHKNYGVPSAISMDDDREYFADGDEECYAIRQKIKEYTSNRQYKATEANNFFMKMLKLNSREIWSKKGTIEGLEQILSMFGYKSKRWVEGLNNVNKERVGDPDYEITEYSMLTNPIVDHYNEARGMYHIDWYNYTKMYAYDTEDYRSGIYRPYQGLPVVYEEVGEKINKDRLLYPYYSPDMLYDEELYYQMNGGWLNKFPITFLKNNEIVSSTTIDPSATTISEFCTETLRNVNKVSNLEELVSTPKVKLYNGYIMKVENINEEYASVDGEMFKVYTENYNGYTYKYIEMQLSEGEFMVGNNVYANTIYVSNPYYLDNTAKRCEKAYNVNELEDYDKVKVYILPYDISGNCLVTESNREVDYESVSGSMACNIVLYSDYLTFNNFSWFHHKCMNQEKRENSTHYFKLSNVEYSNELSEEGWRQLTDDEFDYKNYIYKQDYYKGNNPHYGKENYDMGSTYIDYMTMLFRSPYNDDMFDLRCYEPSEEGQTNPYDCFEDIPQIGFHALDEKYLDDCDEPSYLDKTIVDNKIHYFGEVFSPSGYSGETVVSGVSNIHSDETYSSYEEIDENVKKPEGLPFDSATSWDFSAVTDNENCIVNTKVVELKFFVTREDDGDLLSVSNIERIKYIDDVVMPYASQMIPSGAIVKIKYE